MEIWNSPHECAARAEFKCAHAHWALSRLRNCRNIGVFMGVHVANNSDCFGKWEWRVRRWNFSTSPHLLVGVAVERRSWWTICICEFTDRRCSPWCWCVEVWRCHWPEQRRTCSFGLHRPLLDPLFRRFRGHKHFVDKVVHRRSFLKREKVRGLTLCKQRTFVVLASFTLQKCTEYGQ